MDLSTLGGGGGLPIGGVCEFAVEDLILTQKDGSVWLKTGVLSDEIITYPDALTHNHLVRTGKVFSVNRIAVLADNTTYWMPESSSTSTQIREHNLSDDTLTGRVISMGLAGTVRALGISPKGVTNRRLFWVASGNYKEVRSASIDTLAASTTYVFPYDVEHIAIDPALDKPWALTQKSTNTFELQLHGSSNVRTDLAFASIGLTSSVSSPSVFFAGTEMYVISRRYISTGITDYFNIKFDYDSSTGITEWTGDTHMVESVTGLTGNGDVDEFASQGSVKAFKQTIGLPVAKRTDRYLPIFVRIN